MKSLGGGGESSSDETDSEEDCSICDDEQTGSERGKNAPKMHNMSVFAWTFVTLAFVSGLYTVTYMVLSALERSDFEVPAGPPPASRVAARVQASVATEVQAPAVPRKFCSTASKDLYWLERVGYVDTDRRVSKLMALDNVGADDVHYVFAHTAHVPWLSTCSLESALRAVGNGSRVNAFVVYGIQPNRQPNRGTQQLVSLSSILAELTARYGGDRLNVVHVNVEECLEWSPFQGVDMSGRPLLAAYAVQLVLLWQFGGTTLDAGVVAVRGEVYRAAGTAVEYGDRTVSSAAACHAFVYDTMMCARSYALGGRRPFAPDTGRRIAEKTRLWLEGQGADVARPVPNWLVCRGGIVSDRCYYVETDRTPLDANSYVHGFCPAVSEFPPI